MTVGIMASYRANMFDGEPGMNWLRPGWRALRLYGHKARAAILARDPARKAEMINRADRLLTLMTGILDTRRDTTLGPALMNIYSALGLTLLHANLHDDTASLDIFDEALARLDGDMPGAARGALP